MNKVIPLIAFSILLLIPIGIQNSFADSLIARNGDVISGKTLTNPLNPRINNAGDIKFTSQFPTGGGGLLPSGIFSPTSLIVEQNTVLAGESLTGIGIPVFNDNNDLVFLAPYSFGELGIFKIPAVGSPSLLISRDDVIDSQTLTGFGQIKYNNNGDVYFHGFFAGGSGIFKIPAVGSPSLLVKTGDIIDGKSFSSIQKFDVNDSGDLVIDATFPGGEGFLQQLHYLQKLMDL